MSILNKTNYLHNSKFNQLDNQLDILWGFFFKIRKEVNVFCNLLTRLASKGFYIPNLTLFIMLNTNIDP